METVITLKSEWLNGAKLFAFPDWSKVHEWVDGSFAPSEHGRVYRKLVRDWLGRVALGFPCEMELAESPNFLLLTAISAGNARATLVQLEDYRNRIREALAGLELMEWTSQVVVIVAPDQETFTRYLSDYYGEGEYMLPGGVCLRQGYVHFVLPDGNLATSAPVLAHELAHVCVTGIPWPLWVEEAVVQAIEQKLSQQKPYMLDREMVNRHQRYWNRDKIHDFWSGASFHYPNEGSELSYHLCRFLLEAVAHSGRSQLLDFLLGADCGDAGFAAMQRTLGCFPSEILEDLLGAGDWGLPQDGGGA